MKLTYPDGSYYLGELKSFEPHGRGKQFLEDGGCFEGEFVDGKLVGQVKVTLTDGTVTHIDWDKRHSK